MTDLDLYAALGVDRNATDDDLKRAYRAKARAFHPDTNPDDPEAAERFKEVSLAYEVLKDPERRARYDQFGPAGVFGSAAGGSYGDPFGGGLGDLFDAFFNGVGGMGGSSRRRRSGPTPGPDAEITVRLEFDEAVFGVQHKVEITTMVHCDECESTGAKEGTSPTRCNECQGAGEVRRVRQSILGQVITAVPCGRCQGFGESIEHPCPACNGEGRRRSDVSFTVEIPAGVDDGSTLRLSDRGPAGFRGGPNGALFVRLAVAGHDRFERDDDDLHARLVVPMTLAALGGSVNFATLDDEREIAIEPGTQGGTVVTLRGLGVPRLRGRGRGDLHVHLHVETPRPLDEAQSDLLRQLAELRGDELGQLPASEGLFSKIRSVLS